MYDGLSLTEHQALGVRLVRLQNEALDALAIIDRAYAKNSHQVRAACRLLKAADELRHRMDSAVFAEHRGQASPRIYYPGQGPIA